MTKPPTEKAAAQKARAVPARDPRLTHLLDACLADAPRARAERGWRELTHLYDDLLTRVVRHTLRVAGAESRPEDVEDLVQETYCRLYAARRGAHRRFMGAGEPEWRGYLARIARNVTWDRLRRGVREERLRSTLTARCQRAVRERGRAVPVWGYDDPPTPEERLLRLEERRVFWRRAARAAGASPRLRRRNAVILRRVWVDGWSSREVARSMGGRLTPSTVDSLVHRVRGRLLVGAAGRRYTPRRRSAGSRRRGAVGTPAVG